MFGNTLMMAGLARIIEVCYFAPRYEPLAASGAVSLGDDNSSEHTIGEARADDDKPSKVAGSDAFRHLPPFVSLSHCSCDDCLMFL